MSAADDPKNTPLAATSVAPRAKLSSYPEPFASRMRHRERRALGDHFGLKNFGVNLTRLSAGGESALLHRHSRQDEFVYVLHGEVTLVTEDGETVMRAGDCVGFPAGARAHQLVNRSNEDAVYMEVGDRGIGDDVTYPADDLQAQFGGDGKWVFRHKDGTPYDAS
jgi:uncharacterized cupin superfamily protein